jgi:hypothetical protein
LKHDPLEKQDLAEEQNVMFQQFVRQVITQRSRLEKDRQGIENSRGDLHEDRIKVLAGDLKLMRSLGYIQ